MSFHDIFGIAAGLLEVVAISSYIRSIFKGTTKPNRVTWWILAIVSGIITISYFASGARETIWLPVAYTLAFTIIGLLSIKYGEGKPSLSLIDRISLAGALVSASVWLLVKSPIPTLFMSMVTELIGLGPTINKSYQRPWTENRLSWILATIASFLNVLAVGEWTVVIAGYPLYVLLTNSIIVYLIMRKKFAKDAMPLLNKCK